MENFNYAPSGLNTSVGILWLCVGLINLGISVFMLISGMILLMIFFLLLTILQGFIGIFYLNLTKRSYVVMDSHGVRVDRGMVMPYKEVIFTEIRVVKILGNDIRIALHSGKELRIKLNCLTIDDVEKISSILKESINQEVK